MHLKNYKQIFLVIGFSLATMVGYIFFLQSAYFDEFSVWAQARFILFFCMLVAIKIIGIVWPPISGGLLTLGSIPVIGWWQAYLADLIGSMIGSSMAYYIAKRWGISFMSKIFDRETILQVQN
jgi:uncharacterized membrane protein YdjX (TVP38/TMEM64 family)